MLVYLLLGVVGFLLSKWFGAVFFPLVYFYFTHQKKIKTWWKDNGKSNHAYAKHVALLMGYSASIDGGIQGAQQQFINTVLSQFRASEATKLMNWFKEGQTLSELEMNQLLKTMAVSYLKRNDIKYNLLEVAYLTITAGAGYNQKNQAFLAQLLSALGLSTKTLHDIENRHQSTHQSAQSQQVNSMREIEDAYACLGLSIDASVNEVKLARKRLLNKYHPDKLAQLSDEIERGQANSAVDQINKSYKKIQNYRGFV